MYDILMVDDDVTKIDTVLQYFDADIKTNMINIDYELEVKKACKALETKKYDLLILDIQLPTLGSKDNLSTRGGIDLLHIIENSDRIKKPAEIIGLTAHDEGYKENENELRKSMWMLIKYSREENAWLEQLKKKVYYSIRAKQEYNVTEIASSIYDCAIIVAVKSEFEAVYNCGLIWNKIENIYDSTIYYESITDTGKRLVLACQHQMGMVAASLLTGKIISHFKPKLVCMIGITAGRKGEVNLGDIIIANESWDYGSGKIRTGENDNEYILEPDPHQICIDVRLKEYLLIDFSELLYSIRREWNSRNGSKQTRDINIHIGALASGAAVIQTENIVTNFIQPHHRKVLGIDMETYAVYYAACNSVFKPKFLSIKAVCDYANQYKNDNYQEYAAFVSIKFLLCNLDGLLERV